MSPSGWVRLAVVLVLALGSSFLFGEVSQAQFSLPAGLGSSEIVGPPAEVTRFGNIETIPVESPLSHRTLFTLASRTVYNRSPEALGDQRPVEQREREIRDRLILLLNRPMDPETLQFNVAQLNNVTIIEARDEQFQRPLVLMSVTDIDSEFNGLPVEELAEEWRTILEDELRLGLEKLPDDQRRIYEILFWLVVMTGIVVGLKYALSRRQQVLRRQKNAIESTAATLDTEALEPEGSTPVGTALDENRAKIIQGLQQVSSLDRQLGILDFAQWALFWLIILAWYAGFIWISRVSYYLVINQLGVIRVFLDVFGIWFLAGLSIRLSRRVITQLTTRWGDKALATFAEQGDAQRRQLRASTIAGAGKGLVTTIILTVSLLGVLRSLGLPIASAVALVSVLALAVSFGSRRLVEDLVNGFLILAEDQYAIGDVIGLGSAGGVVENLNLRVTQLRSVSGDLITIPNSQIGEVKNLTRDWSRVNFSIDVAYQTDPDQALKVIQEVAQGLYHDSEWQSQIRGEPMVLGIDGVSHTGLTLTTWIQTEPGQQWAVGREFRLRVRRALAENGIEIGTPRQTYSVESSSVSQADRVKGSGDYETEARIIGS